MKKTLLVAFLLTIALSANAQVTRLFESFESTTFPPTGWQRISVVGSEQWSRVVAPFPAGFLAALTAKHGTAAAYINFQAPNGEDWLISNKTTSPIGTGDSVVFYLVRKYTDGPYPYDSLIVKASATDSLMASFTTVLGRIAISDWPADPNPTWRRYSFPINTFGGQNIYIAFQHKDSDGHGMLLDSISISGPMTTTAINPVSVNTPSKFELHQNYPNPFNPNTNIKFDIPDNGFTTLKVYDMTGSEVASLVSEELNAGSYSINFDASKLSSGIYVYRLESNGIIKTQKMTLVK